MDSDFYLEWACLLGGNIPFFFNLGGKIAVGKKIYSYSGGGG